MLKSSSPFDFVWDHLKCYMLRLLTVMFEMAYHTLPNLSSKKTSPIPILLVTESHGHPPLNTHDAT